jgi:hypothetical protein
VKTLLGLEHDILQALNWEMFHEPDEYLKLISDGKAILGLE